MTGGVPSDVITHQYPGAGHYEDIESVTWTFETNIENDGNNKETRTNGFVAQDMNNLLDRREELADLLWVEVQMAVLGKLDDDDVDVTPSLASAKGQLSANDNEINLDLADPISTTVDTAEFDVEDGVEPIGRPLSAMSHAPYEDGANNAGGGGSASGIDRWARHGWQIGDPVFDERDDIRFDQTMTVGPGNDGYSHINGKLIFGVYEREHLPSVGVR